MKDVINQNRFKATINFQNQTEILNDVFRTCSRFFHFRLKQSCQPGPFNTIDQKNLTCDNVEVQIIMLAFIRTYIELHFQIIIVVTI